MAGTGADFSWLHAPGHGTGNLSTILPRLGSAGAGGKRSVREALLDMGDAAMAKQRWGESVGARGAVTAPQNGAVDAAMRVMRSVMPPAFAKSVGVVNTGFSTLDAQTDRQLTLDIPASIDPAHRFVPELSEYTTIACARDHAHQGRAAGAYPIASLPMMNMFLEAAEAARGRNRHMTLDAQALAAVQRVDDMYGKYVPALNAVDVASYWNMLGHVLPFKASGGNGNLMPNAHGAAFTQLVSYARGGRASCFNLFSPHVKPGTQLYVVCRGVDVSTPDRLVRDARGDGIARRSAGAAYALQFVGLTDTDAGVLPRASACDSEERFWGPAALRPRDIDADYVQREERAALEHDEVIEFKDDGSVVTRPLLAQEGMQEAKDAVPQIVYEPYCEGVVLGKVGMVRELKNEVVDAETIRAGLRSHRIMKQCGVLELYGRWL